MVELTAYSVKLRKKVAIKNPELVTLESGRKAIQDGVGGPVKQGHENHQRWPGGRGLEGDRLTGILPCLRELTEIFARPRPSDQERRFL